LRELLHTILMVELRQSGTKNGFSPQEKPHRQTSARWRTS